MTWWYVYLLQCSDKTIYTGITNNLNKRIKAHNSGTGAKYTKYRNPVYLLISIRCSSKSEALSLEYKIKKKTKKAKLFMISRIQELENNIIKARNSYYNNNNILIVSDSVYDAWVDELTELDPNNKAITQVGADIEITEWKKVNHSVPMGSLDKVNTLEELHSWIVKRYSKIKSRGIFVTEKLDGISVGLTYEKGKLVSAATRGNGATGEEIISNVLKMQGIPSSLSSPIDAFVRGEIILKKSNHQKYFPSYANPRNAASGIAKRYDGKGSEYLSVMCYELITKDLDLPSEFFKFNTLSSFGFEVPGNHFYEFHDDDQNKNFIILANSVNNIMKQYNEKIRDRLDYDIDGLVVRVLEIPDQILLGSVNLRPKGAIAWKFAAAMKETVIKKIIVQVGNSGRVTPVAIVKPTHLMGATIEKASLHNFSNIKKLGIDVGAKILLKRANDVIPYIEQVTKSTGTTFAPPEFCPMCNSNLVFEGEFLMCNNKNCPSRVKGKIKNWIKKLNILEWGDALIDSLIDSGKLETIDNLYELTEADLAVLPRMGIKSAKRALKMLHDNKSISLKQFFGGLSIPMVGTTIIGLLVDAGYDSVLKILKASYGDFVLVNGIGPEKAESLAKGIKDNRELIYKLLKFIKIKSNDGKLKGKSFCFTGSMENKRAILEKMVIDNGGNVKSVGEGLSFLVIADTNSTSSKAVKARKLNIQLISEKDFLKMVE